MLLKVGDRKFSKYVGCFGELEVGIFIGFALLQKGEG